MRRAGTPPDGRPRRAAALALVLAVAAGFAFPLLVTVLAAAAGPEAIEGPRLAEETSAALGGLHRMLCGAVSARLACLPTLAAPWDGVAVVPGRGEEGRRFARRCAADGRPSPADVSRRY